MKFKKSSYQSDSSSPVKKEKKSKSTHHMDHKIDKQSEKLFPEITFHGNNKSKERYDATGYKRSNVQKKDICGYTDDTNPFMDSNLTEQFVWKKNKRQVKMDFHTKEAELENVQKRMREHERMIEERQREHEIIQRAKESQNCVGRKSDSIFDLEQAIVRSKIRIKSDRGQPIDYLIQYINEENECSTDTNVIMTEPTQYILNLDKKELNDLLVDIGNYSCNMVPGKNMQYWADFKTIVEDELEKLSRNNNGRNEGVSKESVEDMRNMVMSGLIEEAIELYNDAQNMLESGDHKHIDISYYEYFCKFARVLIAKRRLQENHLKNLQVQLKKLKEEQGIYNSNIPKLKDEPYFANSVEPFSQIENMNKTQVKVTREDYIYELYEPVLIQEQEIGEEAMDNVIYKAEDDERKLESMRKQFLEFGYHSSSKEDELLLLAQKGDEKHDVNFNDQVPVEDNSFLWSDKYRPRKPRFLNRVNTGFDWNKYNQTHYDIDNPPPKIVQGYKFNILYPDLIDKSKTPTFELSACPDNDQHAYITFKAGPPYQDIAFKIVNKEWETSERFGYKCQFYCNMLQVHFHFKRYRYRK